LSMLRVNEIRGEIRDFRQATVGSFNALREEMNERFERVDSRFGEVASRLDEVHFRLDEHTGRLRSVDEHLAEIKDLIIDRLGPPAGT
jgi:hypothetical protein